MNVWYLSAVLLLALASSLHAETAPAWMRGDDMRNTFAGKRVSGVYPNGIKFEESYATSGAIDYKDDLNSDTGNWSIAGDTFCFFYRSMNGGCFRFYREGSNCYQAVLASDAEALGNRRLSRSNWAVLLWRADLPPTCAPVVS